MDLMILGGNLALPPEWNKADNSDPLSRGNAVGMEISSYSFAAGGESR